MNSPRIVIIGAGPAGLGAAWRLRQLEHSEFAVFEKDGHVGGLATSYVDASGFTWDVGGHVLHSHYPYFDAVFEDVMRGEYSRTSANRGSGSITALCPTLFKTTSTACPPR